MHKEPQKTKTLIDASALESDDGRGRGLYKKVLRRKCGGRGWQLRKLEKTNCRTVSQQGWDDTGLPDHLDMDTLVVVRRFEC